MNRILLMLPVALVVAGIPLAARADTAATTTGAEPPNQLEVALTAGSGGSPLGNLGLALGGTYRRLEAFAGIGWVIGDLCLGEDHPPIDQCAQPVGAMGIRYVVFRRRGFELAPGLGLSFQRGHHEDQVTRPAYGTTTWDWRWNALSPRVNAELEARYRMGPWFVALVAGAGAMAATANECTATNMGNSWSCSAVPSPVYAAPTPFAITAYGQLVIGRGLL